MMMSEARSPSPSPSSGSLLVPATTGEPGSSPDNPSLAATVATWTSRWFGGQRVQPETGSPEMTGGVLSMLTPLTVAVALFPALSSAVPVADCPAPSAVRVRGAEQLPTPDSPSEQLKLTTTSVLFQPLALGPGVRPAVTTGGVLSMLIPLTVAEALLPARSVKVRVALWLAPSRVKKTSKKESVPFYIPKRVQRRSFAPGLTHTKASISGPGWTVSPERKRFSRICFTSMKGVNRLMSQSSYLRATFLAPL